MSRQYVTLKKKERVCVVTINNPPVNALNTQVITELEQTFDKLAKDAEILAVILTGEGKKAFVAGADISEFPSLNSSSGVELSKRGQSVFQKIAEFPYPVICAVNGFALGGGLELALACDIRVLEENARVGAPEITLGLIPGYGGTQRLPQTVTLGKAKELIFTGDMIDAAEAYRIGIADRLAPKEGALEEALKLAGVIASRAPVALKVAKRVINNTLGKELKEALNIEANGFGELCDTEDKNEGVKAFFEKRLPTFQGS